MDIKMLLKVMGLVLVMTPNTVIALKVLMSMELLAVHLMMHALQHFQRYKHSCK